MSATGGTRLTDSRGRGKRDGGAGGIASPLTRVAGHYRRRSGSREHSAECHPGGAVARHHDGGAARLTDSVGEIPRGPARAKGDAKTATETRARSFMFGV